MPAAPGKVNFGAAALIAQLQTAGQAGKQRLSQQLTTSAAAITSSVARQKQALTAAGASQRAAIRAQVAAARADAAAAMNAETTTLQADSTAKRATAIAAGTQVTAHVTAATTDRQDQARTVGDAAATKITQHGQDKAAQTRSSVEGLATSAHASGAAGANATGKDAEATSGKQQAATQLSADTAEGVLGNLSSLLGGVTSAVTEAASSLRQTAGEVVDAIGQHAPEVLSHLTEGAAAAAAGINELVGGAVGALSELVGQTNDKLGEVEEHAVADLDHALATKEHELDRSGQDATNALREQGATAQRTADQQITAAITEAGKHEVTAEEARTGGAAVTTKLNVAFEDLITKITGVESQLCGSLAQVGSEAVATLSTFANSVGVQARQVANKGKEKAEDHVTTVQGQTQEAATRAETETKGITDAHTTAMDQAVARSRGELDAKQGQIASKIDNQVSADIGRVRGPVDSLAGRISGAQNEIENRSAWDSFVGFLGSIGSWLKGQWNDFVEIISNWGFWAGLVVGIVASVFLGPIIGAMIGAAVGTIVSNLTANPPRPWYANLLKNVAIAGVFTAALVVAVTAAVYAGASALVVFIVVEVVTVIGTVLTNWVNGEPLDKGLLANMAIVGLLHLLFAKAFPRVTVKPGETPPEVPPERDPANTNSNERPPEPPVGAGPRTFTELLAQLSAKAQEAVAQQRQLRSPENMRQMENIGRNPDGTYDLGKANRAWEGKWMDDARFQRELTRNVTEQTAKANAEMERIKNTCDENDGTNRPNARVGDGTTEAALREEARTGKPVGGVGGHAEKAATAVRTLQEAVNGLERIKPSVASDAGLTSQIDAAIARATQRISALQGGLDVWNARATLFPDVWFPDGRPRPVTPPVPPTHHDEQRDGGSP